MAAIYDVRGNTVPQSYALPASPQGQGNAAEYKKAASTVSDKLGNRAKTEILTAELKAAGVQQYRASDGDDKTKMSPMSGYSWNFVAPEATLFDSRTLRPVGTHFLNTDKDATNAKRNSVVWKGNDGSHVIAKKFDELASPLKGTVPWLLLDATEQTSGRGLFSHVTRVERVDTVGGVAPSASEITAADVAKKREISVPYQATYRFYKPAMSFADQESPTQVP